MAILSINSNPAVVTNTAVPVVTSQFGGAEIYRVAPVGEAQAGQLKPDDESLSQAVEDMNKRLQAWSTNLRFELDDEYPGVIVQIVDTQTGDVVRQIPTEEVVHLSKTLGKIRDLAFRASA